MTITIPVPAARVKERVRTPLSGVSISLQKFWWHARAHLTIFWVLGLLAMSLLFLVLHRAIDRSPFSRSRKPVPAIQKSSGSR